MYIYDIKLCSCATSILSYSLSIEYYLYSSYRYNYIIIYILVDVTDTYSTQSWFSVEAGGCHGAASRSAFGRTRYRMNPLSNY